MLPPCSTGLEQVTLWSQVNDSIQCVHVCLFRNTWCSCRVTRWHRAKSGFVYVTMQYGTASRRDVYRYCRLRSGSIGTPDRKRAWQSNGCGMHLCSSSKLLTDCSVLYGFRVKTISCTYNTGKFEICGKINGRSRLAAIAGFRHMHADIVDDL
eukprot:jgi/Botrbrau1/10648/Bobra.53_2s0006.2